MGGPLERNILKMGGYLEREKKYIYKIYIPIFLHKQYLILTRSVKALRSLKGETDSAAGLREIIILKNIGLWEIRIFKKGGLWEIKIIKKSPFSRSIPV